MAITDPPRAPKGIIIADEFNSRSAICAWPEFATDFGYSAGDTINPNNGPSGLIGPNDRVVLVSNEPLCVMRQLAFYPGDTFAAYVWTNDGTDGYADPTYSNHFPIDLEDAVTAYTFATTTQPMYTARTGAQSWAAPCAAINNTFSGNDPWQPHGAVQYPVRLTDEPEAIDYTRPQTGMWIDGGNEGPGETYSTLYIHLNWTPTYTSGSGVAAQYLFELWEWDGDKVVPSLNLSGSRIRGVASMASAGSTAFTLNHSGYYFVKFLGQLVDGGQDTFVDTNVLFNYGFRCYHQIACDVFAQFPVTTIAGFDDVMTDMRVIGSKVRIHNNSEVLTLNGSFVCISADKKSDLVRDFWNNTIINKWSQGTTIAGSLYQNIQLMKGATATDLKEGMYLFNPPDGADETFKWKPVFKQLAGGPNGTYGFPIRHRFTIAVATIQASTSLAGTNFAAQYVNWLPLISTAQLLPTMDPNMPIAISRLCCQIANKMPYAFRNSTHWADIKGWLGRNWRTLVGGAGVVAGALASGAAIAGTAGLATPAVAGAWAAGLSAGGGILSFASGVGE